MPEIVTQKFTELQKEKTSGIFWFITERTLVVPHRIFETTYRSHIQGSRDFFLYFLTLENENDSLSRNVGKELPSYFA